MHAARILIYPTPYKTLVFSVFVALFTVIEHAAVIMLLRVAPLLLTTFSVEELLDRVLKVLF